MNKSRLSALLLGSLFGLGVSSGANAGIISFTNNTGGVVDSSSITQSVTVNAGDISGFVDSIVDVNLTVDFSKCSGTANSSGCVGEGGSTFNSEIVFALAFGGASVNIVNRGTFSGQNTSARVTQIYDDEAGSAVGGATLLNGSFQPVGSLSNFDAMSALGAWNFTFQDAVGADPLVVHSWTLGIELREDGQAQVPAPASIALLGLGLVGLGWSRRKKA
jgi:hypothetical protein